MSGRVRKGRGLSHTVDYGSLRIQCCSFSRPSCRSKAPLCSSELYRQSFPFRESLFDASFLESSKKFVSTTYLVFVASLFNMLISALSVQLAFLALAFASPLEVQDTCNHDNVLRCLISASATATPYCSSYLSLGVVTSYTATTTPKAWVFLYVIYHSNPLIEIGLPPKPSQLP